MPTATIKTRQVPFFGYVRKNQPFLIIFNYTIGKNPILVCVNSTFL